MSPKAFQNAIILGLAFWAPVGFIVWMLVF